MARPKTSKKLEAEAYIVRVRSVLDEAHAAAALAANEFMKTVKLDPKSGLLLDTCGYAHFIVYKPSYQLRSALMAIGEIERGANGAWHISNFRKHIPTPAGQSMVAHERVCRAACEVFKRQFPNEGEFYAPSYIN